MCSQFPQFALIRNFWGRSHDFWFRYEGKCCSQLLSSLCAIMRTLFTSRAFCFCWFCVTNKSTRIRKQTELIFGGLSLWHVKFREGFLRRIIKGEPSQTHPQNSHQNEFITVKREQLYDRIHTHTHTLCCEDFWLESCEWNKIAKEIKCDVNDHRKRACSHFDFELLSLRRKMNSLM